MRNRSPGAARERTDALIQGMSEPLEALGWLAIEVLAIETCIRAWSAELDEVALRRGCLLHEGEVLDKASILPTRRRRTGCPASGVSGAIDRHFAALRAPLHSLLRSGSSR